MIRYFVSDIDHTLFDANVGIPQANIDALLKLQASGITLILASGRTLEAMRSTAERLKLKDFKGYLIGSNGAEIQRADEDEPFYRDEHDLEVLKSLVAYAQENELHFSLELKGVLHYSHKDHSVVYEETLCNMKTKALRALDEIDTSVCKLCLHLDERQDPILMDRFVEKFKQEVACERFHPRYMDVMPFGHTKLEGIKRILALHHHSLSEVAAIGDGGNDVAMLSAVGLSAAVSNAKKEVTEVVDMVVADVAQAGVAQFAHLILAKHHPLV